MSEDQKHQVNELLKEQMRLTENMAIQKDKARLAANSILWEVPGLILFVVALLVGFFLITTLGVKSALYRTSDTLSQMKGIKHGSPAYGPYDASQIGIALFYPPLYQILNALAVYEGRLTPTGAHFLVQGLDFIATQAASGDSNNGGSLTYTGYAGDWESIAQSGVHDVVEVLYTCWYGSGMNGGYNLSDAALKACWESWLTTQYRWVAPNISCFLTNPLVSCAGIFNQDNTGGDDFENNTKSDAISYIFKSSVWQNVLGYGMCGYAVNMQDQTPNEMFAAVFGGELNFNGQPFPCAGLALQNAMTFGMMGFGTAGAMSFSLLGSVGTEGVGGIASFMLAAGMTAGATYGGILWGQSLTKSMGCDPKI